MKRVTNPSTRVRRRDRKPFRLANRQMLKTLWRALRDGESLALPPAEAVYLALKFPEGIIKRYEQHPYHWFFTKPGNLA